jgi:hypothetical protein
MSYRNKFVHSLLHNGCKIGQTMPKKKKYDSMYNDDDFPLLGSVTNRETKASHLLSWGGDKKSFKEIVENNEVTFDYDILKKRDTDTDVTYFTHLSEIFKRTTTLTAYHVYTVTSKNKTYRAAARHEIIARLLCQLEENRYSMKASSAEYAEFRQNTLRQMYEDDEMWDDVMWRVGNDKSKQEDAILSLYNDSQLDNQNVTLNWLDPDKVTCRKGVEYCISKEKIIY